jgi:hypothetical protein
MGWSRTASNESPECDVALDRDNCTWIVTGVPAGMAVGVREPVGKKPSLSEAAEKGSWLFAASFPLATGRLSFCEQPASVIANIKTENAAGLRKLPIDSFIK